MHPAPSHGPTNWVAVANNLLHLSMMYRYEKDGRVDLWVEEDFNAGSRVIVSVAGTTHLQP